MLTYLYKTQTYKNLLKDKAMTYLNILLQK